MSVCENCKSTITGGGCDCGEYIKIRATGKRSLKLNIRSQPMTDKTDTDPSVVAVYAISDMLRKQNLVGIDPTNKIADIIRNAYAEREKPEKDYEDCPVKFRNDRWHFYFRREWWLMEYSMRHNTIGFMYEGEELPHSSFILYRSADHGLVPWQSTGAVPERPKFVRIRKVNK